MCGCFKLNSGAASRHDVFLICFTHNRSAEMQNEAMRKVLSSLDEAEVGGLSVNELLA